MLSPALFLDRDGVIIENRPDYVRTWSDVAIFPQALTALAQISDCLYRVILVTNQSVVGRGIISLSAAREINERLVVVIEKAGGRVDGVYMCPHTPQDNCDCRKPEPGLLLQAARDHGIDLSRSLMIGDALSDIKAGKAAAVRLNILVRTGRGAAQANLPKANKLRPFLIYDTLEDAVAGLKL